jgi:hypothetical protein
LYEIVGKSQDWLWIVKVASMSVAAMTRTVFIGAVCILACVVQGLNMKNEPSHLSPDKQTLATLLLTLNNPAAGLRLTKLTPNARARAGIVADAKLADIELLIQEELLTQVRNYRSHIEHLKGETTDPKDLESLAVQEHILAYVNPENIESKMKAELAMIDEFKDQPEKHDELFESLDIDSESVKKAKEEYGDGIWDALKDHKKREAYYKANLFPVLQKIDTKKIPMEALKKDLKQTLKEVPEAEESLTEVLLNEIPPYGISDGAIREFVKDLASTD